MTAPTGEAHPDSPRTNTGPRPGEFTGRHMFWIIVSFFGVIITVNMIMATFAITSWSGLVVKNSYVASQQFNETLETAAAQKARGWQTTFRVNRTGLEIRLLTRDDKPVSGFRFAALLQRPVHERDDFKVILKESPAGHYQGKFVLRSGLWHISVRGHDTKGRQYRQDFETDLTDLVSPRKNSQ